MTMTRRIILWIAAIAVGLAAALAAETYFFPDRAQLDAVFVGVMFSPLSNLLDAGYIGGGIRIPVLTVFGRVFPVLFALESVAMLKRPDRLRFFLIALMTAIWSFGLLARFYLAMSV